MFSKVLLPLVTAFCFAFPMISLSQVDSTSIEEEEDYSMYDDLEFVDGDAKRFASAKIKGLSPAKLISLGYDYQMGHNITAGAYKSFAEETAQINAVHGVRAQANIPVISKNSLIIQVGARFWDVNYEFEDEGSLSNPLLTTLSQNNLRTIGLNSTIYKPLNEKSFLLFQILFWKLFERDSLLD